MKFRFIFSNITVDLAHGVCKYVVFALGNLDWFFLLSLLTLFMNVKVMHCQGIGATPYGQVHGWKDICIYAENHKIEIYVQRFPYFQSCWENQLICPSVFFTWYLIEMKLLSPRTESCTQIFLTVFLTALRIGVTLTSVWNLRVKYKYY